jgi:hypothetical protein
MKRTLALVAALVLCTLPILLISLVLGIKSLFGGFLFAMYLALLIGGGALLILVVLPALRWIDKMKSNGGLAKIGLVLGIGVVVGAVLALWHHAQGAQLFWTFALSIGAAFGVALLYRKFMQPKLPSTT